MATTSQIEVGCRHCGAYYMYLMDVIDEVEFLACFKCMIGWIRYGKELMRIV